MISLIVAMAKDRVIGKNNALPWHLSDDLKRFKKLTMGHPIIMGRRTFESIGKPLLGRHNIVLTKNKNFSYPGVTVLNSLDEVLDMFEHGNDKNQELFIIGGAGLFEKSLPIVDKIYLTLIDHQFDGDVRFPEFDLEKDFNITEKISHREDGDPAYEYHYITATRK